MLKALRLRIAIGCIATQFCDPVSDLNTFSYSRSSITSMNSITSIQNWFSFQKKIYYTTCYHKGDALYWFATSLNNGNRYILW